MSKLLLIVAPLAIVVGSWIATARLLILVTVFGVAAMIGCAGTTRSVFHPTDPTFAPRTGPMPRVYLHRNLANVPASGMRSVGLIAVTVRESSGIERAIEVATDKGSELGCWILIEHSAFEAIKPHASIAHGATVILIHGSLGGLPGSLNVNSSSGKTTVFDCIMPTNSSRSAFDSSASARGDDQFLSINWIMGMARHPVGTGDVTFRAMLSAERRDAER